MHRERRHGLHEIEGEIRATVIQVKEQMDVEPNEEAKAELTKAMSHLIDATENILTATEVEDEPRPAASVRRPRRQRDAPGEAEEKED